jgi:N-methylhydantoinase A/oxoprolinase/acetone carboxylase beta subunit
MTATRHNEEAGLGEEKRTRLAFDIGGTFTDFALLNEVTGEIEVHKRLTTPHDPSEAALEGISSLLGETGAASSDVQNVTHGTTLVTNALIERKGSKVALLTTKGFRDVLELRNEQRYDIYDFFLELPDPLVPRHRRLGIDERVDRHGRILKGVERDDVAAALDTLRQEEERDERGAQNGDSPIGLGAVAICFLNAYRNNTNEQAAAQLVSELWPEIDISVSSVVAPEIREYERTSTVVANAYVRPVTRRYLERLTSALATIGYQGPLYLMLSSGGITALAAATQLPIQLVESGPAGGAIGAAFLGSRCGIDDLISFDMGGTTAKICLVQDGRPAVTHSLEVARLHRFKKGSGLPLQMASVEMMEIGAGGGSIARIDDMGFLKVGPHSAGADPGPACYGAGGTEPTVTDADLVLGYLDPDYFLAGRMQLDTRAAERAIEEKIAVPLGLTLIEAAWGIHRIVNENMASAAKIHIIERGADPRRFALLAFGGAGPVHATGVAEVLHADRIICPLAAGVLSAIGFLVAPFSFEFAQSLPQFLDSANWDDVNALLADLETRGRERLEEAGVMPETVAFERSFDARFAGQLNEIAVELTPGRLGLASQETLEGRFNEKYKALYGHLHERTPVEALTWRVVARGELATVRLEEHGVPERPAEPAQRGSRPVYWGAHSGFVETPVFDRYPLQAGVHIDGPAVVEERESTVLVPPGSVGTIDGYRNLIINRRGRARWSS